MADFDRRSRSAVVQFTRMLPGDRPDYTPSAQGTAEGSAPLKAALPLTRRMVLASAISVAVCPRWIRADPTTSLVSTLPQEVAGVAFPNTPIAIKAANFSRAACPDFLFNHAMRTFLFGALYVKQKKLKYDGDTAFVAAALHDLGLLSRFATASSSFEIDGANAAERFMRQADTSTLRADAVWHAVAMHDGKWALTARRGTEAMLVAAGAAADVDGPDNEATDARQVEEIVAAFPRLKFKQRFTALLIDHCKRKPISQRATWLEGLCREQVPSAWSDSTEQEIANAPFAE